MMIVGGQAVAIGRCWRQTEERLYSGNTPVLIWLTWNRRIWKCGRKRKAQAEVAKRPLLVYISPNNVGYEGWIFFPRFGTGSASGRAC